MSAALSPIPASATSGAHRRGFSSCWSNTFVRSFLGQQVFGMNSRRGSGRKSFSAATATRSTHRSRRWRVNFAGRRDTSLHHRPPICRRLYRKSTKPRRELCYLGHVLRVNRHGLVAEAVVTDGTGPGESDAGAAMLGRRRRGRATVAPTGVPHARLRGPGEGCWGSSPVAQNGRGRRIAIDPRTTRPVGYSLSQRICHRGCPDLSAG